MLRERKKSYPELTVYQRLMSNDLLNSYNQAEYYIDGFKDPIKIGQINQDVEDLLRQNKATSWCFITAWNPLSEEIPMPENLERNKRLRKDLAKYTILAGEGRDPQGEWTPERSLLVIGISEKDAKALARKYRQRAIVFGEKGKSAELIETISTNLSPSKKKDSSGAL
jgi:hypothetical protein